MVCREISAIASAALAVVIVCPLAAARGLPREDECIHPCEERRTKVIEQRERGHGQGGGAGIGGSFGVAVGAGVGGRRDYDGAQSAVPIGEGELPACNKSDLEAEDPKPDERCQRDCQTSKAERDAICGGLPTEEAREACLASSANLYERCREECPSGNDVEACKRRCDRKAAAEHKKCSKMAPGPGRAKCRQAVEERRASCYRDCERKAR